jgi:hypothetical protein
MANEPGTRCPDKRTNYIQRVAMKFNLGGIFDAAIDALRIFYTSPDALLLGSFLIQKSESS